MKPHAHPWRRAATGAVLAALLVGMAPAAGHAKSAPSKAESIAVQARAAYDAAQFERSLDLYLAAYRADSKQVAWLYAAARAAHLANKLDRAEELYLQALRDPGLATDLAEKAREHLQSIATRRAELRAEEAEALQKSGLYQEAAEVWRSAAALQPGRAIYLCRAARAAKLARQRDQAIRDYQTCRDRAPVGSTDRAEAERALAELERERPKDSAPAAERPAKPKSETADPPDPGQAAKPLDTPGLAAPATPTAPEAPAAEASTGHWAVLGGGAALVLAGLGTLAWAWGDEQDLNGTLAQRTDGRILGISYSEAQRQQASINLRYGVGWTAAGLGGVALGLGTWLALQGPTGRVTLVPTGPASVGVALRF